MGTFVTTISQEATTTVSESSSTFSEPLIKIKEYHGMFKYVCDSFIINMEQSKEIFGGQYTEKMKIWDPEQQGKIDALEIFCGLIIFAREASFKKKLSFLFSIFDFNEIKSLSFIDVEVIVLNVCNSVYKILGHNGKVNEHQIAQWLAQYLNKRERVKITQLYRLCLGNSDIRDFFTAVNKVLDEPIDFPLSNEQTPTPITQPVPQAPHPQKHKEQIEQNLQFHRQLIKKIIKVQDIERDWQPREKDHEGTGGGGEGQENNYGCRIKWVYGINIDGIGRPFIVMDRKGQGEEVLYRVGSMAVIQELSMGTQCVIEDEKQQISCIAYNRKYQILATAQHHSFPQLKLYKKSPPGPNRQTYQKYGTIQTNHEQGITLLQFIIKDSLLASIGAREQDSPVLIYDIFRLEVMYQILLPMGVRAIWNPFVMIQRADVPGAVFESFYVLGEDSTIFEIVLKNKKKKQCPNPNYELHSHPSLNPSPTTSTLTLLTNLSTPYLQSYSQKSCTLTLLTGHKNGSLSILTPYSSSKCKQQEIVTGLDGPVLCMQCTRDVLAVAAGGCLYVYGWGVLAGEGALVYRGELRGMQGVVGGLFSYFDFLGDYILAMTEKGQFLKLQPKPTVPPSYKLPSPLLTPLPEQLPITPITTLTKLQHTPSSPSLFTLLTLPQTELLLLATNNNKILSINTMTKQIEDVWEINAVQSVVVLDAVVGGDGVVYVICACRSGRLYIRIDWEDSPKFYDCGSQIIDAKISKDCSYLLVATKNNYLLFFAQINSTFTSPRKLLFEYQTPCSINFLDNYKFFLVTTSAKNSYLIEIPQLKHKKLQKETQKISISRLNMKYPYAVGKGEIQYSSGCIGGCMKFSILAMHHNNIYFFPNPSALEHNNYSILNTHKGPVSQVLVNEDQTKFYTLGRYDDALIEWEVFETKFRSRCGLGAGYLDGLDGFRGEVARRFQDVEEFGVAGGYMAEEGRRGPETFFFRGTKLEKLNQAIEKYYPGQTTQNTRKPKQKAPTILITPSSEQLPTGQPSYREPILSHSLPSSDEYLSKRCPNTSLKVSQVYGYEIHHKNSLSYTNNGTQILGYTSRFIIRTHIKTHKQTLHEPTNKKISYLLQNPYDNEILYSVIEPHPKIHILSKQPLPTSHPNPILHMCAHRTQILSYAKGEKDGYSINLHDYGTGELLRACFTGIKVGEFLGVGERVVVSIGEVRVWTDLYPSEVLVVASAGCLLPNGKDVLLGLYDGKFAILSNRGIFQLNNQAHQKAIDLISIRHSPKYLQKQSSQPHPEPDENFQIISVGRDEKIKIWNSNFQAKLLIFFRQKSNISFFGENNKEILMLENIYARSIDVFRNKVLLGFNTGHVVEIQIQESKRAGGRKLASGVVSGNGNNQGVNNNSDKSLTDPSILLASQADPQPDPSLSLSNPHTTNSLQLPQQLSYKWSNLLQVHQPHTKQSLQHRTAFSLNSTHKLLATCAQDSQLLIRNYETNAVVYRCYYQGVRIECVRFCGRGRLLAVGFDSGEIRLYEFKVCGHQFERREVVTLKLYQKLMLKVKEEGASNARKFNKSMPNVENNSNFSIINMEYSPCDTYLAVSYIYQQQSTKKFQSYVSIFKTKQSSTLSSHPQQTTANGQQEKQAQKNQGESNQEQFYFLIDTVEIGGNVEQIVQSKYVKSVYFISFYSQGLEGGERKKGSGMGMGLSSYKSKISTNNNITTNSQPQPLLTSSSHPPTTQTHSSYSPNPNPKGQIHLILYEQYLDSNKVRIHNDNKIKIKVYLIEDKLIQREDYCVDFFRVPFPCFVRGFAVAVGGLERERRDGDGRYGQGEKRDCELTISAMLISGNTIYYGDTAGRLHLVKLSSLLPPKQPSSTPSSSSQPQTQSQSQLLQYSSMNLSKVYNSHTSFINAIEMTQDKKYLFVSGGVDGCVVKYRVEDGEGEGGACQLDGISYPLEFKDVHDQYLSKGKFYQFLNNIDPIRDQISDVMLDVEDMARLDQKINQGVKLKPVRIFGRRAFDKRNNLFEDYRGNLIYSLGPNIIIQDPCDPLKQTHIPADPNPYSNSPQLSCLSLSKSYLIACTQQQNSRILIWDIFSKTRLSSLQTKSFSIIHHQAQSSTHPVLLLYGLNKLYEPCLQLLNWQEKRVLGHINMMYSGVWKIKDMCEVEEKGDGLEFVTVGVRHLMYWEYVGENLVGNAFGVGQELGQVTFMVVRTVMDMIVVGGENGCLYLFRGFQLCGQVKAHTGPIRALAIESEYIFSGGMDGIISITALQPDESNKETLKKLSEHSIKSKTPPTKPLLYSSSKQSRLKRCHSLETEQQGLNGSEADLILAEEDIQAIVVVRSQRNFVSASSVNLYVGTRAGNILLVRRELGEDQRGRRLGTSNNISGTESVKAICRRTSALCSTDRLSSHHISIQPLIHSHDNDTIASLCFNENHPDLFYILTCSGVLQIWSLHTLRRLYLYKLAQQVSKIFCFKDYIIICCQRSIRTIKVDIQNNSISYVMEMSREYEGVITDCCMSRVWTGEDGGLGKDESEKDSHVDSNSCQGENQRKKGAAYLVVGLKKSQFNEIIINEISNKIQEKFVVVNLKYEIEFMDFSRDCKYLLFKDSFEELGMVNLLNYKRINTIFVQMGAEWESEGVRISPHGQRIYCSYSRENKITVLRRIGQKQIVIGDQMGTLRIFEYPCPQDKLGELHSECYTSHMNFIKNIEIHPNRSYALTSAVYDRSLILWKIVEGDESQGSH